MTFTTTRWPLLPALTDNSFKASLMSICADRRRPGTGDEKDFLLSSDDQIGHVANDIRKRCNDSQRNSPIAFPSTVGIPCHPGHRHRRSAAHRGRSAGRTRLAVRLPISHIAELRSRSAGVATGLSLPETSWDVLGLVVAVESLDDIDGSFLGILSEFGADAGDFLAKLVYVIGDHCAGE